MAKSLPGGNVSHVGHKSVAQKAPKVSKGKELGHKQGHSIKEPGNAAEVHASGSPAPPHSGGRLPMGPDPRTPIK